MFHIPYIIYIINIMIQDGKKYLEKTIVKIKIIIHYIQVSPK